MCLVDFIIYDAFWQCWVWNEISPSAMCGFCGGDTCFAWSTTSAGQRSMFFWFAALERISVKVKVRFSAVPFTQPTMFWLKLKAFPLLLLLFFDAQSLCESATETNVTHFEIPPYNKQESCCCDQDRMNTWAPPAWLLQEEISQQRWRCPAAAVKTTAAAASSKRLCVVREVLTAL